MPYKKFLGYEKGEDGLMVVNEEQAKAIMTFAKPSSYPVVKDGGEASTHAGSGKTRDQFASWLSEMNGGN